jgi:hypothetical protein
MKVTKLHTVGILKGLTTTEETKVHFVLGKTYRTFYKSEYEVVKIDE